MKNRMEYIQEMLWLLDNKPSRLKGEKWLSDYQNLLNEYQILKNQ